MKLLLGKKLLLGEYLKAKGIRIKFIHEETGIPYSTVLAMANNTYKILNVPYLEKIAQVLKVKPEQLISD